MNSSKTLKIILAGLDNAGKSSMLVVLKRMYQFEEEVHSLQPTIRIEHYRRNFLGYLIDFHDMGGQLKYRERYLERSIYFEELDSLIYLIDITDTARFNESVEYLEKILAILKEIQYNKSKEVYICFTKMDYDKMFSEKPEYIVNLAKIRKEIMSKYPDFKFDFFSTSIYNIYSIVKMLSKALTSSIKGYKDIYSILDNYSDQYGFNQILLFDDTGLMIAEVQKSIATHDKEIYAPQNLDKLISSNLEYFKKVENNEDPNFKFFQHDIGQYVNFGYRFSLDENMYTKATYYVSIVDHESNPKKLDWDTQELVDKLKDHLIKMK